VLALELTSFSPELLSLEPTGGSSSKLRTLEELELKPLSASPAELRVPALELRVVSPALDTGVSELADVELSQATMAKDMAMAVARSFVLIIGLLFF
jgi:hypothetical protein